MKTIYIKSILVLLAAGFFASCATGYEKGNQFEISLERNGIGGYQWEYVPTQGVALVDSTETLVTNNNTLSEYTKTYTLQGVNKGNYELVFRKKRSFEPDSLIPEENYRTIKVRILK